MNDHGRMRPFFAAFFLTVCIFSTIAGMVTVDFRCRTMTLPRSETAVSFALDSMVDGDGGIRFCWFDSEHAFRFCISDRLQAVLNAAPVLIPRPLRAAALLLQIPPSTQKDGGTDPPSFLFEYF